MSSSPSAESKDNRLPDFYGSQEIKMSSTKSKGKSQSVFSENPELERNRLMKQFADTYAMDNEKHKILVKQNVQRLKYNHLSHPLTLN